MNEHSFTIILSASLSQIISQHAIAQSSLFSNGIKITFIIDISNSTYIHERLG